MPGPFGETANAPRYLPQFSKSSSPEARCVFGQRIAPHTPEALHDLKVGHHHHVLVFEVVAVEDVAAPVALEADEHARLLARGEVDGVLPAGVVGARTFAVAREHLEVDEVEVDRNSGRAAMRSGVKGSPLMPHIVLPLSATRVKRNSRVSPALDSVSPSNSFMSESRRGTVLSSLSLRVMRNRITFAVPSLPIRFFSVISSPTSYFEKSTTTSKRSACAIRRLRWGTGAPSSPPSLPT